MAGHGDTARPLRTAPTATPASWRLLNDARLALLRKEQISGHSETLRQRADMRQRQPSFYRAFYPQVFASKAAAAADIFMNNVNVLRGIG
jgi:hypothetical protein